jgi:hypothetical protein
MSRALSDDPDDPPLFEPPAPGDAERPIPARSAGE